MGYIKKHNNDRKSCEPDSVPEEFWVKYEISEDRRQQLYSDYKLYQKVLMNFRKHTYNSELAKKKLTYHCGVCNKTIKYLSKYIHIESMKHLVKAKQAELDAIEAEGD